MDDLRQDGGRCRRFCFQGLASVFKRPHRGVVAIALVAYLLFVAVLAYGLFKGQHVALITLIPIAALTIVLRRPSPRFEQRRVPVELEVRNGVLRIRLSEARLFDGRYIDQVYLCEVSAVKQADLLDDGRLAMHMSPVSSFAVEGGDVKEKRVHESFDFEMQVPEEFRGGLEVMLFEVLPCFFPTKST